MNMRDMLSIGRIVPSLRTRGKRDALRKLAAHAARDIGLPVATVVSSVLESSELPAFGPGAGVALPHAFVPGLAKPIVTFARLEPAVDFGAADGSKTDLVALLLSPADGAGDHLQALACVARTLRDRAVRDLLRAAESRDRCIAVLCAGTEQESARAPISAAIAGSR
jgi:PTS system nitrogen regulatory IIA component